MSTPNPAGGAPPLGPPRRPPPDPVLVAMVAAALEQLRQPAPAVPAPPGHAAWRFSGRWWYKPVPARRDRPWPAR